MTKQREVEAALHIPWKLLRDWENQTVSGEGCYELPLQGQIVAFHGASEAVLIDAGCVGGYTDWKI